jgi:energy-coupling factor transport system substrate-specific component
MRVIRNARLRNVLRYALPLAVIPAVIAAGLWLLAPRYHMLVTLAVLCLSLLLFLCGFERRMVGVRRQVIVAVMVALSVVGRFIPFFKPITALTTVTGIYLGGEAGFLVGALSAVLSNFFYGQGPWTPFQMLAWGLIGWMAGVLSPILKKRRWILLYGVASGIGYSLVMDVWSVLWYNGSLNGSLYLTAMLSALPHTLLYAVSNFVFLWFLEKPFGEKLARIQTKYGL